MKSLSPLFLAGLCAATFSGCYMDRNPTMTLEDRMMASDRELSEYEAAKKAEAAPKARIAETPAVPGVASDADALKAKFPAVGTWREGEFSGRKFVFGITTSGAPADIHGWVFEPEKHEWRRLFVVTLERGASKFVFDETTGVVSVNDPVFRRINFLYDLGDAIGARK